MNLDDLAFHQEVTLTSAPNFRGLVEGQCADAHPDDGVLILVTVTSGGGTGLRGITAIPLVELAPVGDTARRHGRVVR